MKALTIFLLIFIVGINNAQPQLELKPNKIEFRDIFDRLENVLFINKGNQDLVIDTIRYNNNFYFIRFDKKWQYPVTIPPGDTLKMDCLLAGYFLVTSQDTLDTMKVIYSGYSDQEDLKIRIRYYDDEDKFGTVSGTVLDENNSPLNNSKIYFYYDGSYLFDTTYTNAGGQFSKKLPQGNYTIAAEKAGYYFTFYDNQYDPYNAKKLPVERDSVKEINFNLIQKIQTQNRVLGKVIDVSTKANVRKGIIVVRKGKHTPTKLSAEAARLAGIINSYTVNINDDGTFAIDDIIEPGYYYVQAFSDFYLPAYVSNTNDPAIFWQQTDSILIQNTADNKSIFLKRDSSYGGGIISGYITADASNPSDSVNVSDIILFAKNVDFDELTYYSIPNQNGSFRINHLPYGKYRLIAQSIGFADAVSTSVFDIAPSSTEFNNTNLHFTLTSVSDESNISSEFKLFQNYPNPFNPTTLIKYSISNVGNENFAFAANVMLKVYDILGKEVATLINKKQSPGNYSVEFNAGNLASGIYIYQLRINGLVQAKKMILLR